MRATPHVPGAVRVIVLVATFQLGRLASALSPHAYLWLLMVWVVMCAALTTRPAGEKMPSGDPSAVGET